MEHYGSEKSRETQSIGYRESGVLVDLGRDGKIIPDLLEAINALHLKL